MRVQCLSRAGVVACLLFCGLSLAGALTPIQAQRLSYSKGQPVFPAFEGWEQNPDGSFNLLFGYMNQNWDQEPDVPVGPNNMFSPGAADRGQPTHFLPRRNRYTFAVRVPADFGDEELVWTLRVNGQEFKAYGSLRADYFTDSVVMMSETGALGAGSSSPEIRANRPPEIELVGPIERTVRMGEPLTLAANVSDDGQPPPEGFDGDSTAVTGGTPQELLKAAMKQSGGVTVNKAVGLYFTWFVYRGSGKVTFDPPQIEPWEDTRTFANSPWATHWMPPSLRDPSELPPDGRWVTTVHFFEQGEYVIRGRADDGGLYADVEVVVNVVQ